jgi:hypothetical protein
VVAVFGEDLVVELGGGLDVAAVVVDVCGVDDAVLFCPAPRFRVDSF